MVAKPGLSWLARLVLNVAAYFKASIGDLPYSAAAVNPYPLPSLITLGLLAVALPLVPVAPLLRFHVRRILRNRLWQPEGDTLEDLSRAPARLHRARRIMTAIAVLYSCFLLSVSAVSFSVLNKAILIRRTWDANFDILAGRAAPDDIRQLRARFAAITSRKDYEDFCRSAQRLTESTPGVRLRDETDGLN